MCAFVAGVQTCALPISGGFAHDFNSLLTVIVGSLDLAGGRAASQPQLADLVNQALSAAEKGAALTHRLLAFSRQQPLQPTDTDQHGRAACRERGCQYV